MARVVSQAFLCQIGASRTRLERAPSIGFATGDFDRQVGSGMRSITCATATRALRAV